MSARAAVIVPTHDHASTLGLAVRTALAQTVADIEVHVIGDGVGDDTRGVVEQLVRDDPRVRFHDLPKGARHGETHRHQLIGGLDVGFVTYLSDDDLLRPEHVESMAALLIDADFAHPPPILVEVDGSLRYLPADLSQPIYRTAVLGGHNRIPLTGAAHTMDAYRRLPHGWRTTPSGKNTDLYMWQQFLAEPWCRAVTGTRVTALSFPSLTRGTRTAEERATEQQRFWTALSDPDGVTEFERSVGVACRSIAVNRDGRLRQINATRWWRARTFAYRSVRSVSGLARAARRALPPREDR